MIDAFLLTRQFHESEKGITLELWFSSDSGAIHVDIHNQEAVAFIRINDLHNLPQLLNRNIYRLGGDSFKNHVGEEVVALYSPSYRGILDIEQRLKQAGIPLWEANIRPAERYCMERFITGSATITSKPPENQQAKGISSTRKQPYLLGPRLTPGTYLPNLRCASIDIETSMDGQQLYSIGVFTKAVRIVFMVDNHCQAATEQHHYNPSGDFLNIKLLPDEKACLQRFFTWVKEYDPDIFIGWNIVQFDIQVLSKLCDKHNIPLDIGRGATPVRSREDAKNKRFYITIPGRLVLDGIEVLRTANYHFASFKLNDVAESLLGDKKLITHNQRGSAISELFHENKTALAEYNIQDCKLVWDIFKKTDLINFCIARTQMTGLLMDRMGGSVAAFEFSYLPHLHRKGYVAPNLGELTSDLKSPGGYVLDSTPGIYNNILVLDFKSLYPSIIRTFCIDPYSYWYARDNQLDNTLCVPGFNEAKFSQSEHILPSLINQLWEERDKAKANNDQPLSHAIKIIMNSFYGVLGSNGCRFYDPRVCSSITLRGHEILQQTQSWIEAYGHRVIYGDTDSVFVWVGNQHSSLSANKIGKALTQHLNEQWNNTLLKKFNIQNRMEIEFETLYTKFVMPTIRNSTLGSKKRYAGIVEENDTEKLVFKGLENARTDWTELAKVFQYALYQKVFNKDPVSEYIRAFVKGLITGQHNTLLLYNKRLRQDLHQYKKNTPPHAQAALKAERQYGITFKKGDWITYYLTTNGPEYSSEEYPHSGRIDYDLYVQRQLKPIANSILQFIDLDFDEIISQQLDLF